MTEPQDPYSPPSDPYAPPPADAPTPPGAPQYGAPQYGAPQYGAPQYGAPVGQRRNGLGTAALVLGILSVCGFSFVVPPLLALVFGLIGRSRAKRGEATNKGVATAGAVLGAVFLAVAVAVYALLIANHAALQRYSDCQDAHVGDRTAQDQCARDFVHDVFGVDVKDS